MDDRSIILLLRLVHILAGIFWVGTAFIAAGFLVPALRATGPAGAPFVRHIMQQRRLPAFVGVAMLLTVLSGLTLYGRFAAATHGAWAASRPGMGFGIGGVAAILGALVALLVSAPAGRRMAAVGGRIAKAGGPSPDDQAEMARLQARIALGSRLAAALLAIAAAAMATARYL